MIVKLNNGLEALTGDSESARDGSSASDNEIIYRIQFALLMAKLLLNMFIPELPGWIGNRISQEKLKKVRVDKKLSRALSRIGREGNKNGEFDSKVFEEKENLDLERYFNNYSVIGNFDVRKVTGFDATVGYNLKVAKRDLL